VKLPKEVQVGPYAFAVSKVDEIVAIDEEVDGLIRTDRLTIEIKDHLGSDYEAECLIHECLHAVWFQTRLPDKGEEEIVKRLAPALLDLIRRNPDLVAYFSV